MKRITVFIVDDSAAVRDGLESILAAQDDLEVTGTAKDGAEAAERVPALTPDVVLMDAQMPVLDGACATRRIKQADAAVQVLFLSVHASYLQQGLDAGADAALLKDVGRTELLGVIRDLGRSLRGAGS